MLRVIHIRLRVYAYKGHTGMANLLLKNTLNGKISVEDIINWLATDDIEKSKWDNIDKLETTQCEFVIYFLNFLRDQTKSLRPDSCTTKQSPTKSVQTHVESDNSEQNKIEKPHRRVALLNFSENEVHESRIDDAYNVPEIEDIHSSKNQTRCNVAILSKKEMSPTTQSCDDKLEKKIPIFEANAINEFQLLSHSCNNTPDKVENHRNLSDDFNPSSNTTTSTPILDKNSSNKISKTFNGSDQCGSIISATVLPNTQNIQLWHSQSDASSLSHKTSENCIRKSEDLDKANENFDSSNCLLISKHENISHTVETFSKRDRKNSNSIDSSSISDGSYNERHMLSNTSSRSKNSAINESPIRGALTLVSSTGKGVVSPLHVKNSSTPQNSKLLYSRSVERSQNSKNSPQQNSGSTPKQGSHKVQRKTKITPRQNVSLGDFISIETKSSKKNSAKRTNTKMQSLKQDDNECSLTNRLAVTEESFPEIGKNCGQRKRRIKPTKLDVSDDKGNNKNTTFGTISRPQIINPQFLEALPTDKSDTTPFETERDLLRLERQKQREILANPLVENNVPLILLKSSTVKKSTGPLVTSSLQCVENRQALDILAKIYSSLLDNNLVLNPMTEFNFVISLLCLQYFMDNDKCQVTSAQHSQKRKSSVAESVIEVKSLDETVTTECDESSMDEYEKSKEYINIEFLNEELGCKILNDDTVSTIDKNLESQNNIEFNVNDKAFDNLTKSSLDHEDNNCTNESQLVEESEKINLGDEEYFFKSIHNCVYFSTTVLNNQRLLLSLLDRATLKLLCENNRIATFSPDLQEYLKKCYTLKSNESSRLKPHFNPTSAAEVNVSFQIDTDNYENFASRDGFQSFKKQRDLFYDLLRTWEKKHLLSGWKFSIVLGGKVKALFALNNDTVNHCHFARLFKSQLLLSCIGNEPQEDPPDDESISFLKSLKHLDPEKLSRLQERLVTPLSSTGPVPAPTFPGVQEFYKNFILSASSVMFHIHLQDSLVHEIMELNDTQFTGSEIEDTETMVDKETQQKFIACISSLRLLAKFLGFLVSAPYKCDPCIQESVLATYLELRSQVLPPINLQSCLRNSIANGKLTLTIPWVVKYLAMLDPVSLRLPYYRTVFEMLCYIYCDLKHDSLLENPLSSQVITLIKFSIGWLFELCNFPETLFFNCRISKFHRKLKSISSFDIKNPQNTLAIQMDHETSNLNQSGSSGPCIDSLDIVDERVLYVCCPFLTELKTSLIADPSNINNSATIRHITPVSSGLEKPYGSANTKQLQLQLEEAFFHGQPNSTRKTVDFVSERVASSCVKHICNSLLPAMREKTIAKFQNIASQHTLPYDSQKFKSLMSTEINSIALDGLSELKLQIDSGISVMCDNRTKNSIESLLAEDTLPLVKEMCIQIAIRMATERINHWIQSHINDGSVFIKDMKDEIDKIYKNKDSVPEFEKRSHSIDATSPTDAIDELRSLIWELTDNEGQSLTLENVLRCLDNSYESLTARADLLPDPEKIIGILSVDFTLFLAAHRTDIFLPEVHDKLIRIWKLDCMNFLQKKSILARIFSPRNIMLLAIPDNPNVWLPLGKLINKMLREEILSIEALSDQCTIILRYDWQPVELLKHISACLAEGIKNFHSTNEESEKMNLLLQWITETCNDIEVTCD